MPLDRLSEHDRSRLAQLMQGPLIPPATPPQEPPRWNWPAAVRTIAGRYMHRRKWIAGGAAAIACLALLALSVRVAAWRHTETIQLQVQERQGHLQIRWDAGSDLIRRAKEAKLFITDGSERLFVTLDAARLRHGTVAYARQSERVEFRMALVEPDGRQVEQQAIFFGKPLEEPQLEASAPPAAAAVVPATAEPRETIGHRSRHKPLVQTGTNLPFTCSTGDTFRKTDAPPGWDTFTCRGNNVWGISRTQQEDERPAHRPNATTLTAKPSSASTT